MRWIVLTMALLLAGCEQDEFADLRSFMAQAGQGGQQALDPLPQLAQPEEYQFVPEESQDPFKPRNLKTSQPSSGVQPDMSRQKEYLEGFPLDALRMVGTLEQGGQRYALVKAPDGAISRVKKGNYMGQNYGKVVAVSESGIELIETIQDGAGEWTQSKAVLALQE
jgi:type IV pilus assembly protein PilP